MSDDETRPIGPDAPAPTPAPPPAAEAQQPPPDGQVYAGQAPYAGQPPYAMPLPAGYPAYAVQPLQAGRPRFGDQVMGMWAVVAVALACLIIGGLSGFILGRATGDTRDGFVRGPGFSFQRGPMGNAPNGFPNGQNGFSNQKPSQSPNNP
jgi:hypothetical protein